MKQDVLKKIATPRRVLPLMIGLAVMIVGVRVNDMWDAAAGHSRFHAITLASAEDKPAAPTPLTPEKPKDDKQTATTPGETPKPDAAKADASKSDAPKPDAAPSPPPVTAAASPEDTEASGSEMALIKELSARREQLDKRNKTLDTREALIKVAETRVDQKIKEMETLRTQLQAMVNTASEAQQTQFDNLVKIYETMKPKEAAKIFETLELPTLLGVVQRMKPTRTAPIMAEMAPEKAKEITVALTKQDQLPQIK